jgi:hypothetical protein
VAFPYRLVFPFLFLLSACAGPATLPSGREQAFDLRRIMGAPVAVWPLAVAHLDEGSARAALEAHGSREALMDAVSGRLSDRILSMARRGSLSSFQVMKALGGDPRGRELLEPGRILGSGDPDDRFRDTGADLRDLRGLPLLAGVKYLVVPRDLVLERRKARESLEVGATRTVGQGGVYAGIQVAGTRLHGHLRLAVLDLATGAQLWEGDLYADGPGSSGALPDLEDDLAQAFAQEVFIAVAP